MQNGFITLLHFDNMNNPLEDDVKNNPVTWTKAGNGLNGLIVNAQSKYGSYSFKPEKNYNNPSNYAQCTLDLRNMDFTIDIWSYKTSTDTVNDRILPITMSNGYRKPLTLSNLETGNGSCPTSSDRHSSNTWNLNTISYKLNDKKWYYFLNGNLQQSESIEQTLLSAITLYLNKSEFSGSHLFTGYLDELSIRSGVAYNSNFTVPTKRFFAGLYAEFPNTINGEYDRSPNGLKYKYRVRFEQGPYTETSNVVNYETTRILSVLRKILIINILYKYIRSLNF